MRSVVAAPRRRRAGRRVTGPLVKVIVPCYGYADCLERCVESVLGQEGVDVRVLIIDDHSPDDTPAVARRLVRSDERRRVPAPRAQPGPDRDRERGPRVGRRQRLRAAAVCRRPAGARVPAAAASVMESQPGVGLVYGHAQYFESGVGRCRGSQRAGAGPRSGPAPTGSAFAAARPTTASPRRRPSSAPRCSARSAATTPPAPHQRPQHVAAHRRGLRRRLHQGRRAGALPDPRRQHAAQRRGPDAST